MKGNAEIPGAALGEIRVGEEIGAATIALANPRRVHEKTVSPVSPVGIASEHRSPKPAKPTRPAELTKPTRLRPLLDRPSDR
jgi:hypothetical protein